MNILWKSCRCEFFRGFWAVVGQLSTPKLPAPSTSQRFANYINTLEWGVSGRCTRITQSRHLTPWRPVSDGSRHFASTVVCRRRLWTASHMHRRWWKHRQNRRVGLLRGHAQRRDGDKPAVGATLGNYRQIRSAGHPRSTLADNYVDCSIRRRSQAIRRQLSNRQSATRTAALLHVCQCVKL